MFRHVAVAFLLALLIAACGDDGHLVSMVPKPAEQDGALARELTEPHDRSEATTSVEVASLAPLELPIGWTAPVTASDWDDPKTAPYWRAPDRYSEVVYTWEKWRLVDVNDQEREFAHVRVEYDGVLQFLTTGCSGYAMGFYDSEDFMNLDEGPEEARPPTDSSAATWQLEGRNSTLAVEDLTGMGGATVILLEWTGGNHVYRQISFLHLQIDGRAERSGPFDTAMYVTDANRTAGDTVFTLYDAEWQGWKSCMAGSPSPAVKLSFRGGRLRSCNGTIPAEELEIQEAALKRKWIEQETSEYDLHLDYYARDLVLDLVYHGQLDDAKRVLGENWSFLVGEQDAEAALKARNAYWNDIIRTTRSSSLYRLLEREFPQIEDEYYSMQR